LKILINRQTDKVVGVNIPPTPFTIALEIPDDLQVTKVVEYQDGTKHKKNDQDQPLYKDNVVVDPETQEETYDEVTEKSKAVEWEDKDIVEKHVGDDGTITEVDRVIQVPTKFEELDPVIVPNMLHKSVRLKEEPTEFTLDEILNAKYLEVLNQTEMDYILADIFLSEDDIDLKDESHKANTGKAIVQILPQGQVKTKNIQLASATDTFKLLELNVDDGIEIYIAGKKFVDGIVDLSTPIESCTIKFLNTTDKPKMAFSYAIGYKEVI
jgi:hypothetical protein